MFFKPKSAFSIMDNGSNRVNEKRYFVVNLKASYGQTALLIKLELAHQNIICNSLDSIMHKDLYIIISWNFIFF